MTIQRRGTSMRRAALLGGVLASASRAMAFPLQEEISARLHKRKTISSADSDDLTAGGKVPLDAILLIGAALAVALVCTCISLWNVKFPGSSNSRVVIEERARARTELRLRGGGSARGSDMATLLSSPGATERKSKRMHLSSRASSQTLDSKTHLIVGPGHAGNDMYFQKPASHIRPKLAHDRMTSTSRASRGYSVYSTKDLPRRPMPDSRSNTVLQVPTLMQAESDSHSSSSLPSSSNSRDVEANELPSHARPQLVSRNTNGSINRISTSLGAGTDLARHRSIGRDTPSNYTSLQARRSLRTPNGPRPIDATYGQDGRVSPMKPTTELSRAATMTDHSRSTLAPIDTRMSHSSGSSQGRSRAGSSHSTGHEGRPTSYFDAAASDDGGYHTPVQQHPLLPRSPANAERRSRPLAYYDRNDQVDASAAQHFTRLLESPGAQRQYGLPI